MQIRPAMCFGATRPSKSELKKAKENMAKGRPTDTDAEVFAAARQNAYTTGDNKTAQELARLQNKR